ncbi:MAG: cell shape determination protein CcmA [Flavobacteriales bacterium]|nr:cell shape determination protein CcmA [Flavobacteriales bacterium]|tara:strand:+ start:2123 stop:2524 length:402 start_codon:yes stop_codon:yes gene_type:complete
MLKSTDKQTEVNSIAKQSKIEGTFSSDGDVRIDGYLNGALITKGKLVLGPNGVISGEVDCTNAIIAGEVKANIRVKELLTLKSTSRLSGEIIVGKLAIEPGAIFTGKCSMGAIVKEINKKMEENISDKTAKAG